MRFSEQTTRSFYFLGSARRHVPEMKENVF